MGKQMGHSTLHGKQGGVLYMKFKAHCSMTLCLLFSLALLGGCLYGPARTADIQTVKNSAAVSEPLPALFWTRIQAGQMIRSNQPLHFVAGESIRLNISYMPDGKMNFGFIDPDGTFRYLQASHGHFDKIIIIEKTGDYTLQFRNKSSTEIDLSGYVDHLESI